MIVTAVYIPPDAGSTALTFLLANINKHLHIYPDAVLILAGHFNLACLQLVLPNLVQHVNCATRGNNTLDCVYSNLKQVYRAMPLAHSLTISHCSCSQCMYPLRKQANPTRRTIKAWLEHAPIRLQDFFWVNTMAHHWEYTETVLY